MILPTQLLDLLALLGRRQIRAQAAVGLGLADPFAQHLMTDAEIARDRRDRPARLKRQPHTTLDQLLWILPGSGHELAVPCSRTESSFQSLRETQASSNPGPGAPWCGPPRQRAESRVAEQLPVQSCWRLRWRSDVAAWAWGSP